MGRYWKHENQHEGRNPKRVLARRDQRAGEQRTSDTDLLRAARRSGAFVYEWRRRLKTEGGPVRFALVDSTARGGTEPLELILATGERLRITPGTDTELVKRVVEGLRP